MSKKNTTLGQLVAKLSNNKMVKVVAGLFKKESFELSDEGHIELSEEEEEQIKRVYGEEFLNKLKGLNFADESAQAATDLFDAAVEAMTAAKTKELNETIEQLRNTVTTLSGEPEPKPQAQNAGAAKPGAAAAAQAFAINMKASYNKVVAAALASENPFAVNLGNTTVDVTDLNQEFSIAMPPKYRLEILLNRIYKGFTDSKYFTPILTNTDYIASAAVHTEVSQQFTNEWTPKGKMKFTPIRIPYRRHKINEAIKPTEILKSWLLYLYEQGKNQAEMPFVRYVVEVHILPKVVEDIQLTMIGKGKYNPVDESSLSAGDAGSAAKDSMDGIETILVEGHEGTNEAAKKINFLKNAQNILTMTDKEAHDYIDAFVDKIVGQFVDKNIPVYCAPEVLTKYLRAEFAITGVYTGKESDGSIRFTKAHLYPMACMYNSPILFSTPKENMGMIRDLSNPESCINDIQRQDYDVKIFGEYALSVGFKIAEAVFASVPTGYTPYEAVRDAGTVDTTIWENGGANSGESTGNGDENPGKPGNEQGA